MIAPRRRSQRRCAYLDRAEEAEPEEVCAYLDRAEEAEPEEVRLP